MKEELIAAIDAAPAGRLKQLEGKYIFIPGEVYAKDETGAIVRTGYVCSYIVAARKYGDSKINLAMVALDDSYDGSKIGVDDDEYLWVHDTVSIRKLAKMDIADSFDYFK